MRVFTLSCSVASDSVTPRTVAHQAPLSMGFSRQEYWVGLPFPLPRDLLDPGIQPLSLQPLALAGGFFATKPPGKPHIYIILVPKANSPSILLSQNNLPNSYFLMGERLGFCPS